MQGGHKIDGHVRLCSIQCVKHKASKRSRAMVIRSYNHGRAEDSDSIKEDDATQLTTATSASTSTATTTALSDMETESCQVCLVAPRDGFALVPCGHARLCESSANRLAVEGGTCPVRRTTITMVMHVFL